MISSSSTTRRAPTSRRPAPSWHRSRGRLPLGLRSTEAAIKAKPVPTAAAAAAPRARQPQLSASVLMPLSGPRMGFAGWKRPFGLMPHLLWCAVKAAAARGHLLAIASPALAGS